MKRRNIKRWLSVAAIALTITVAVTGCRPSPVLEDIVYTDNATLDPDHQSVANMQDEQKSNDYHDEVDKDTQNIDKTEGEKSAGKSDPDGSTDVSSKDIELAENTKTQVKSDESSGNGSGNEDGNDSAGTGENYSGNGNADTGGNSSEDSNAVGNGSGEGSGIIDNDQEDPEKTPDNTGAGNNVSVPSKKDVPKKVVTDVNGVQQQIPEDVYTVTAVGPVATMVEMLGGSGRLLGSSESFTESDMAQTLFSDIDEINTWWADTGESAISDEDFQELLQESPDVCFEISGQNTFTEEQVARLQELEIGYLVLPELDSTENLKDAVSIVANALETNESNGKRAKTIASNYMDWVDDTVDEVSKASGNSWFYTMYIKDYREDISFSFESHAGEEDDPSILPADAGNSGVAVLSKDAGRNLQNEMLHAARIAETVETGRKSNGEIWWSFNKKQSEKDYLVHPLYGAYGNVSYTGNVSQYTYPTLWEDYKKIFGIGVNQSGSLLDIAPFYNEYSLGQLYVNYYMNYPGAPGGTGFPVLLVANETIKSQIEQDFYWQFHGYAAFNPAYGSWDWNSERYQQWLNEQYGFVLSKYPDSPWLYDPNFLNGTKGDEENLGGAYLDDDFWFATVYTVETDYRHSKHIKSAIFGKYDICIVPTGIDSWADGCVEAPLEAYWAANKISGTISESMLINRMRSFYQTFFGVTLRDSQLKEIIG